MKKIKMIIAATLIGSSILTAAQTPLTLTVKASTETRKTTNYKSQWVYQSSQWYYYDESGRKETGWLHVNGYWYYLDSDGVMKTGWVNDNGTWYYLNDYGAMETGWIYLGSWYYLQPSGAMKTGWAYVNNYWYYLNEYGAMKTGWVNDNGTWYYLNKYGAMETGFIDLDGRYYLNKSGAMQLGLKNIDGKSYYFNDYGRMVKGWGLISNNWYYFNEDGTMKTGWVNLGKYSYYLNEKGIMQTGWQLINNKWYYFYPGGDMAVNTTIDGYVVGADGVWIPSKPPVENVEDKLVYDEALTKQWTEKFDKNEYFGPAKGKFEDVIKAFIEGSINEDTIKNSMPKNGYRFTCNPYELGRKAWKDEWSGFTHVLFSEDISINKVTVDSGDIDTIYNKSKEAGLYSNEIKNEGKFVYIGTIVYRNEKTHKVTVGRLHINLFNTNLGSNFKYEPGYQFP